MDFDKLYIELESKYNDLPTYMSRAEVFSRARADGTIDSKTFMEARRYFGNLWFYIGD